MGSVRTFFLRRADGHTCAFGIHVTRPHRNAGLLANAKSQFARNTKKLAQPTKRESNTSHLQEEELIQETPSWTGARQVRALELIPEPDATCRKNRTKAFRNLPLLQKDRWATSVTCLIRIFNELRGQTILNGALWSWSTWHRSRTAQGVNRKREYTKQLVSIKFFIGNQIRMKKGGVESNPLQSGYAQREIRKRKQQRTSTVLCQ